MCNLYLKFELQMDNIGELKLKSIMVTHRKYYCLK